MRIIGKLGFATLVAFGWVAGTVIYVSDLVSDAIEKRRFPDGRRTHS